MRETTVSIGVNVDLRHTFFLIFSFLSQHFQKINEFLSTTSATFNYLIFANFSGCISLSGNKSPNTKVVYIYIIKNVHLLFVNLKYLQY